MPLPKLERIRTPREKRLEVLLKTTLAAYRTIGKRYAAMTMPRAEAEFNRFADLVEAQMSDEPGDERLVDAVNAAGEVPERFDEFTGG